MTDNTAKINSVLDSISTATGTSCPKTMLLFDTSNGDNHRFETVTRASAIGMFSSAMSDMATDPVTFYHADLKQMQFATRNEIVRQFCNFRPLVADGTLVFPTASDKMRILPIVVDNPEKLSTMYLLNLRRADPVKNYSQYCPLHFGTGFIRLGYEYLFTTKALLDFCVSMLKSGSDTDDA
jgi:hypothetical protein